MRDQIITDLSSHIDKDVAIDLLNSYEQVVARFRGGDVEGSLVAAGRFVEHTFRALEFVRSRVSPKEIKSPAKLAQALVSDASLHESIRVLIPRVALAMVYDIRSKRGAVHVKDVDPRGIDAALSVNAASWIVSEFLRLYHQSEEEAVSRAIQVLMYTHIPYVESLGDQFVVTRTVPAYIEVLLLLSKAEPTGLDRASIGRACKYSPSTTTRAVQRLEKARHIHKTGASTYRITGTGARHVSEAIAKGI